MHVLNVHSRVIQQPIERVNILLDSLASDQDLVWPSKNWPAIRLNNGIQKGSKGGHGPIQYTIQKSIRGKLIIFEFTKPSGFQGDHRFEITKLDHQQTKLVHIINMRTTGSATFLWFFAIRWLHDALIEDLFDNVEKKFLENKKRTRWSRWVKILRWILG